MPAAAADQRCVDEVAVVAEGRQVDRSRSTCRGAVGFRALPSPKSTSFFGSKLDFVFATPLKNPWKLYHKETPPYIDANAAVNLALFDDASTL